MKKDRSVAISIPSRWAIKEDPQRASILGREINPDDALAMIKTTYEIKFSTSKAAEEKNHENCGVFKMVISVSDFKQRHPNLAMKSRSKYVKVFYDVKVFQVFYTHFNKKIKT